MKRSELHQAVEQILRPAGEAGRAIDLDYLEEFLAERAGVTWEPEEPRILWESSDSELRLLDDGTWQLQTMGQWIVRDTFPYVQEVADELSRRLLAEYRASSAMEQGFKVGRRVAEDLLDREHATDGGTFWAVDPETGKRELPVNALRELELRRDGWVDLSPDAELDDEEIAREKQHATDGSPCWCEPKTESPWHDEVERRLKALEDLVEGLPLAVSVAYLKAKEQKSDENS